MKYRFFHIPVLDAQPPSDELNRFLAEQAVVAVERQFVADGGNSFWAFSISYRDGGAPEVHGGEKARKPKVDYREVLDTDDFTLYAALRSLRKEIADREGVPAYALFTNEQLAAIIHAACFADRVLHHAVMLPAGPVFERTMTDTSYACRPGKGHAVTHNSLQSHFLTRRHGDTGRKRWKNKASRLERCDVSSSRSHAPCGPSTPQAPTDCLGI